MPHFTLVEMLSDSDCANGEQRQHDLAVPGQRVDVFLLEPDFDAQFLEMADGFQKVDRVPGESRYALGEDDVDLPGLAVVEHSLEFRTFRRAGSADALIGVDARVLPFRVLLDQLRVVAYLRGKGVVKPFGLHGHAGVCRHLFPRRKSLDLRLYLCDFRHGITPFVLSIYHSETDT